MDVTAAEKRSKILAKVVKLFDFAHHQATLEQRGATESEVEVAVTQARRLMAQHLISMAEVEEAAGSRVEQIRAAVSSTNAYTRKMKNLAPYDRVVASAVAKLTNTFWITLHRGGYTTLQFVGEGDDVQLAITLFFTILEHVRAAARRVYGSAHWRKPHTSYAVGFAHRLLQRAEERGDLGLTDNQMQTLAMVVYRKQEAIQVYVKEKFPNLKVDNAKLTYDLEAYWRGHTDGSRYDLGPDTKRRRRSRNAF